MKLQDGEAPLVPRPMTEDDLALLHEWLQRSHLVRWWGGEAERPRSLAQARQR